MLSTNVDVASGGLGRLAAWHLPGGSVGPASRWATIVKLGVGQTTYPVNRGRVWKEGEGRGEKKKRDTDTKRLRRVKEGLEWGGDP